MNYIILNSLIPFILLIGILFLLLKIWTQRNFIQYLKDENEILEIILEAVLRGKS